MNGKRVIGFVAIATISVDLASWPAVRAEPRGFQRLTTALRKQSMLTPLSRERVSIDVPTPTTGEVPVLEAIGADPEREQIERVTALVMLGKVASPERRTQINDVFSEIFKVIAPFHVHPAERFVGALERAGSAPDNAAAAGFRLPKGFGPGDIPILANMALAGDRWEYPRRTHTAMALASLGLTGDRRALDILLSAPPTWLGDAGRMRDAALHGMQLLCRDVEHRDALAAWLAGHHEPSLHRSRAILALAYHQDDRALKPLADLIRGPKERADSHLDPTRAHAAEIEARHLPLDMKSPLLLCQQWKAPQAGAAVLDYLYSGGQEASAALRAAAACGATPDKRRLWPLTSLPLRPWEKTSILRALAPLLAREDVDRIVAALAPAEWESEGFYVRVLWIKQLDVKFLVPRLRDVLLEIARDHKNGAVKCWALEAMGRFRDRVSAKALHDLAENEQDVAVSAAALEALLQSSPDPYKAYCEALARPKLTLRHAAYRLLWSRAPAWHREQPLRLSDEQRVALMEMIVPQLAANPAPIQKDALQALYVLMEPPSPSPQRSRPRRSDTLDRAILEGVRPFCGQTTGGSTACQAANCLWALGGPEAVRLLQAMAKDHPDRHTRTFAAQRLSTLKSRDAKAKP